MNLAALLARTARAYPDRPAVALADTVHQDYGALARRAGSLAATLRDRFGLAPGDRVALAMKNCPAFFEVLFGIWSAGLTAVPMNAKLHPKELEYILDHSGTRVCFATAGLVDEIAALAAGIERLQAVPSVDDGAYATLFEADPSGLAELPPDGPAWLFYTSGTTGRPKGALLSHGNLMAMTSAYLADVDWIAPTDSIIHAAPLSHGSGLYGLAHIARGACHVIPASGGFEEAELFDLMAAYSGVSIFCAPTMVVRLVNAGLAAGASTETLKTLIYGGGPMYVEDAQKALAFLGPKLVQIYGQGESPMTIAVLSKAHHADHAHPRHLARLGSTGVPFTEIEVRVVDAEDAPLPPGEAGEILVRGPTVMQGYWRDEAATAKSLAGGWLHTGDVGALDDDGFLTLMDRSKDMIISGGTNIYPREIEEVLLRHAGVLECSVVGRPHPEWGEEVIAFVVPRAEGAVETAALDALCLDNIARFKRPRGYRFVAALPKNNYGKVLKTELREQLAEEERT
jgi:long-chain acyl-CoA synthetase